MGILRFFALPYPKAIYLALSALALGGVVYYFDRPPVQFVNYINGFNYYSKGSLVFGVWGYSLPSFLHTFSLILLTAIVVGFNKRNRFHIYLFWFLIETLFEIGQHSIISPIITTSFQYLTIGTNNLIVKFFQKGTFDYMDLIATSLGALAGCVALEGKLLKKRGAYENQ